MGNPWLNYKSLCWGTSVLELPLSLTCSVATSLLFSSPTSKCALTSSFIHTVVQWQITSRLWIDVLEVSSETEFHLNMPVMMKLWIHVELLTSKSVYLFSSFTLADSVKYGEFGIVTQRNFLVNLLTLIIAVGWNIGKDLQSFVGDRRGGGGERGIGKGWFSFHQE